MIDLFLIGVTVIVIIAVINSYVRQWHKRRGSMYYVVTRDGCLLVGESRYKRLVKAGIVEDSKPI